MLALPQEEEVRLAALRAYEILDTPAEETFDELARLAAMICGTGHAGVSVLDREREWFKAQVGWKERDSARTGSFCEAALQGRQLLVVPDARADDRFASGPLVARPPKVRFYACHPLHSRSGVALGALCVMDSAPREGLSDDQQFALRALAHQAEAQLELRLGLRALEKREIDLQTDRAALIASRREREQVAAQVVHDLRSPLTAMLLGVRLVAREPLLSAVGKQIAGELEESAEEVQRRILDLADVSRTTNLVADTRPLDLGEMASSAAHAMERRAHSRNQRIEERREETPVRADARLLKRAIESLLDNALKNAPAGSAVMLETRSHRGGGELRVVDAGPALSDAQREHAFGLLEREPGSTSLRRGGGLGLAFCKLAVEAQQGRVWVEDGRAGGAVFCLWMPAP